MTANPQIENGHLDLANELVDQFCRLNLSPCEWRVLWAIWRKTYGWHKPVDRITFSQFEKITGLNRWHIQRYLNRLIERNIIIKTGSDQRLYYAFQKDYSLWKPLPKQAMVATVTQTGYAPLPEQATKPLHEQVHTKERKETNKRNLCANDETFAQFWDAYPRKVGKKPARQKFDSIFKKLTPEQSDQLLKTLLDALEIQKQSDQWQKDNGQYIPHPATWLNQERWNDVNESDDHKAEILQHWGEK